MEKTPTPPAVRSVVVNYLGYGFGAAFSGACKRVPEQPPGAIRSNGNTAPDEPLSPSRGWRHTSRLATLSALSWMNSRRGSTTSPISLTKMSSASSTSLILT